MVNKKNLFFFFVLLLGFNLSSMASDDALIQQDTTKEIAGWKSRYKKEFISTACDSESFYRQCFVMNNKECEDVFAKLLIPCMENINEAPVEPTQSMLKGSEIGSCVSRSFTKKKDIKKIKNSKCNDFSAW